MKHCSIRARACAVLGMVALASSLAGCGQLLSAAGGGGGGPSISLTANPTTLNAGETSTLTLTTKHSGGNDAVNWSLSSNDRQDHLGAVIDLGFGPLYRAPEFVSPSFQVTVTARSVANSSISASVVLTINKSLSLDSPGGNDFNLVGPYVFVARGGGTPGAFAVIGSFVADGMGKITSGLIDMNSVAAGPQTGLTIPADTSLYSVGGDHRGSVGLVTSLGTSITFRFALHSFSGAVATAGRMIEFDDETGNGTRAEGFLVQPDPSSFATDQIAGAYAFGMAGPAANNGRFASAGVISASSGDLSFGNMDTDDSATGPVELNGVNGAYDVGADGRGTLLLNLSTGQHFALYMVSAARFITLGVDPLDVTHPLQSGEFRLQEQSSFDNSSLNAPEVVESTSHDDAADSSIAVIGLNTPDGNGNADLVIDVNDAGTFFPLQSAPITYDVAANGRTRVLGINDPPVLYLLGANEAFSVSTGPDCSFGFIEPQVGGPFDNSSLNGRYSYGTDGADVGRRLTATGTATFDGDKNVDATEDEATPSGLFPNVPLGVDRYSFSASSSPVGRGTVDSRGETVAYIISATKLVFISTVALQPQIVVVQKE
jgi:hypothetical protein